MKRLFFAIICAGLLFTSGPTEAATQFDFLLSQVRTSTTSLAAGKVYFYSPGTTTAKAVYLDRNMGTQAANPYTLDANGTAQVYGSGIYRVVIKDSAGVTKFDRDNIIMSGDDGTMNPVDATAGNQTFTMPATGIVTACKTDSTANTVTLTPPVGTTLVLDPLSVGGECVKLGLIGLVWYRGI
jgi:hypothetical protein